MSLPRSSLPKYVTQGYWQAVRDQLQRRHQFTATKARRAVADYRRTLANAGVRDMIYHSPIDETADGIVTGEYGTVNASNPGKKLANIANKNTLTNTKRARKQTSKPGIAKGVQTKVKREH
jgi:hypothetical protein